MKLFSQLLVLGLAAEVTVASNWFSKAGMHSSPLSFKPIFLSLTRSFSQLRPPRLVAALNPPSNETKLP
jgi:hypothetical protein